MAVSRPAIALAVDAERNERGSAHRAPFDTKAVEVPARTALDHVVVRHVQ